MVSRDPLVSELSPALGHLYSIGHSNHPFERFAHLLSEHAIDVVVDVRSQPFSRFASQFDKEQLERRLVEANDRYLFLGRELGGRPADEANESDQPSLFGGEEEWRSERPVGRRGATPSPRAANDDHSRRE